MKAACPSCGADVIFKSSISVFSVCDHCKSMIVRHDMDVETLGQMAQLPDDVSPLKIGSRGKYKNTVFEIIGRLKVAWSEGCWNEWLILFENGKHGWLAEAMGLFMLSSEVKETGKIPGHDEIEVGKGYDIVPMKTFFANDIKEAVCVGSEGELPFKGLVGRKTVSIDFSDRSGEFACIEYSSQDGLRLYIGRYVEFGDLDFSNLRDLAADIRKIRSAKLFKCPSCGGPFSMRTPGHTASVACGYCGSVIDATNRTLQLLCKVKSKMKIMPLLPIGSRGKLFDVEWEVIGFMRRADVSGQYPWDEYLLFNPRSGFRWLTTYKGHWNYVEMVRAHPVVSGPGSEMKFAGKTFNKFLAGKAKVVYVLGEFYWRVRIGDTVGVADYICPPEILSCERDKSEFNWSLGKYIEPLEIAQAFDIKDEMPSKEGIAPNQPSPYGPQASQIKKAFAALAVLLTVMQFYFVYSARDREVYRGGFTFEHKEASKAIVTPSFELQGRSDNLSVSLESPVQNDWMEAGIDLVDEKTNKSLGFEQGVEFYSGTDSDGHWSEGSRNSSKVLSFVPAGRYHLLIQPAADTGKDGTKSFTISLRRGVVIWSNYFTALFLLGIYPAWVCLRGRAFEVSRWSESDLSPYKAAGEEED
ncbi:MAG: DUF4178 domain-containing protein [Deltaproteobacteria bacterium]|nr:DUF4178 domain-containing protein [Deltaproteobacteria bacterium]